MTSIEFSDTTRGNAMRPEPSNSTIDVPTRKPRGRAYSRLLKFNDLRVE